MSTGFAWHELFNFHDTGTAAGLIRAGLNVQPYEHVESAESKSRFAVLVGATGVGDSLERIPVVPVSDEDLLRVHTREHVERIRRESDGVGGDCGTGDRRSGTGRSRSRSCPRVVCSSRCARS